MRLWQKSVHCIYILINVMTNEMTSDRLTEILNKDTG